MFLLAKIFPDEQRTRIDALINRHVEESVNKEWPEMAHRRTTISTLPTALIEELHDTLVLKPADDSQRIAQVEMVKALHIALDARRQAHRYQRGFRRHGQMGRDSASGTLPFVAVAVVYSDNRLTCAITLSLFATGIALSVLLIAAYSRPFNGGGYFVAPELLKQVIASEATVDTSR